MFKQVPKGVLVAGAIISALGLLLFASLRPYYFNLTYIGGLILCEFVAAAVWKFRQVFFPLLITAFLLAGTGLPGAAIWTAARWVFLGVGAAVGLLLLLKERKHSFGMFHAVAFFAVLASGVSAMVSRYPVFALLKASSLFLLFLYAASGARVAVRGREQRFFAGLLLTCEWMTVGLAVLYLFGVQFLGNPNSLGAVVGVVLAPLVLWGAMVTHEVSVRRRRFCIFAVCMYLVSYSHSRASLVAAAVACGLLCIGLRKYRALVSGVAISVVFLAATALLQPERFSETTSTVSSEFIYKGPTENGIFASRRTPWQEAVDSIHTHFWFGTGFGTVDKGKDVSRNLGNFASTSEVTLEYGSSYLEIVTWVGMLGMVPFLLLLLLVSGKVLQTIAWMFRTGSPSHPAVPLAFVTVAAMVHAAFEDWMFAPGYYLCVFFWCTAFVLVDLAPALAVVPARLRPAWFSRPLRNVMGTATPTR